jgi:hypothetical protein
MRLIAKEAFLGQESFVPEWALPLLGVLGVCLLVLIVLTPIAVVRSQRTRTAAVGKGIRIDGVRATKALKVGIGSEELREEIRSIVQSQKRFSRVEDAPGGVDVYVRGNFWTWGEVIEVRFSETNEGTDVYTTCRPRLTTTLADYGQSGSDLNLFIDLLEQRTETSQLG